MVAPSCSSSKYSVTSRYTLKRGLRVCRYCLSKGAVKNCIITGSQVVHYRKIFIRWMGCRNQETYNLVPAPHMLLATWTNSKIKPRSSFLVERVVRQLSVGFGGSEWFDCLSNFAVNGVEGVMFGKPLESKFIDWEWDEVLGHFITVSVGKIRDK